MEAMEKFMEQRFTAPRNEIIKSRIRWQLREFGRWFVEDGLPVLGEFVLGAFLLLAWVMLPIMAAMIGG